jgi:hypothetical protein
MNSSNLLEFNLLLTSVWIQDLLMWFLNTFIWTLSYIRRNNYEYFILKLGVEL